MGVLRKGRFVYANEALLELLGVSLDAFLQMSLTDPIAPEDRERVRERHARRLAGQRVPNFYRFDIVRSDGTRRAVSITVSRAGEDVVFQLLDQTDEVQRQERIRAIAKLGAAVQAHHSEAGIFHATESGLVALGLAVVRIAPAGTDGVRVLSAMLPDADAFARFETGLGLKFTNLEAPRTANFDRAWSDGGSYLDDTMSGVERFFTSDESRDAARRAVDAAGLQRSILLRIDVRGQPSQLLVALADWLRPEDLPTFSLFGTQVSSALDAALVIDDLSARNAELSALNHVAIAAGTLADLKSLFARAASEICSVLGSAAVAVYLIDAERRNAILSYEHGGSEAAGGLHPRVPLEGSDVGSVARDGVSRVYPGTHVLVSVPLRVRSTVVGAMNVTYGDSRTIPPRQVEVLEAMAAHLAAAVEANRLVTDLRKSYADLSHAQEQLVQRERLAALGELAAAVAHEVRNPLGVIFNSLTSLQRLMPDDASARMLFNILGEEADRLNHIVGDLLDFARPTHPSLRPGPLQPVLDEAVEAALARVPEDVRTERELDRSIASIPMDARLLRQALLNVFQNAVQAMPSGGTLAVRTRREDRTGRAGVRIEIADTGAGIAPDVLSRIFEPFFTTRATGTGLGLAVVKRIVENHRGEIEVQSEPGRGATFVFWLPS
jgi:PAS domain S-box-containing protein